MAYALWERQTLESFFGDNWVNTPVKWESHPFVVPKDSDGSYAPYVAFLIRGGTGVVVSLGSSLLERQSSLLVLQVFAPELTGRRVSLEYADTIMDLFIPQDFTDGSNVIRTRAPYTNLLGVINGWLQTNIFVPYILDTPILNH